MPATKLPTAKKSSYRLPCVYCNNETTFPSSEKLKEHLLSQHKNNVCRSRQSVEPPPERPSFFTNEQLTSSPANHKSSTFSSQNLNQQLSSSSSTSTPNNYSQHQSRLSWAPLFSTTKSRYTSDTIQQNNTTKQQQQQQQQQTADINNDTLLYASPARSANTTNYQQQQQQQQQSPISHFQNLYRQNSIFTASNNLSPDLVSTTSHNRLAKSASTSSLTNFGSSSDVPTHAHQSYKSATASGDGRVLYSRSTSDLNMAGKGSSAIHDKNMKRLVDNLTDKDVTISRLQTEVESLKSEIRSKEEEHSHVKQRWRQEAEDALRNLKTNYHDVCTQKRLLEKHLHDLDGEKESLRSKNHLLEKDLADLQTDIASKTRDMQLNLVDPQEEPATGSSVSTAPATSNDREVARVLMADLQTLRKENQNLTNVLGTKNEEVKVLGTKLAQQHELLQREKALHMSAVQNAQNTEELRKTKNTKTHETKQLKRSIENYLQKNLILESVIKVLKEDKATLVNKLQSADGALTSLSSKISLSKSVPNLNSKANSSGAFSQVESQVILDQSASINNNLEEILGILKQRPAAHQAFSQQQHTVQVHHLTAEVKRLNLDLVNEKANVCKLKKSVHDLEEALQTENDMVEERDQKSVEIQKLRAKIQLHDNNQKSRRQLSRDKKMLQRKHSSMQKELKVVNTLYQTSTTDIAQRDNHILELLAERKRLLTSTDSLLKETKEVRMKYQEKDKLAERYKRESCILLEKLNTSNEEHEEMKRKNEMLENRLNQMVSSTDMNEIKKSLVEMQLDFSEMKANKKQEDDATKLQEGVESKYSEEIQSVYKKNDELLQRITTLENQLFKEKQIMLEMEKTIKEKDSDIQELESLLDQQMSRAESAVTQSEMQYNMNETKHHAQMDNLRLENEILESRVLILEGISHELDILTAERDTLKRDNKRLRNASMNYNSIANTNTGKAEDSELILVNNLEMDTEEDNVESIDQLLKNIEGGTLKVDKLDDKVKEKLKEMLSAPEFERFLSDSEVVRVNLMESSSTCGSSSTGKASLKSLSRQTSFEKEHTINHMYQASSDALMATEGSSSYEDVIQVYSPSSPAAPPTQPLPIPLVESNSNNAMEQDTTINYGKNSTGVADDFLSSPSTIASTSYSEHQQHQQHQHQQQRYSSHSPSSPRRETLAFGNVQSGSTTSTISIRQSPSKDSLASNMSTKLERIFSESKSISNDIATKQFNMDDVDYKRVLTEFHKMISQMSQSSSSGNNDNNNRKTQSGGRNSNSGNNNNNNNNNNANANSKTKRVTFSDHIVDFDQNTSDDDDTYSQEMESTTASWSPTTNTINANKNNNNNNNTDSTNTAAQMTRENQNFYMSFFQDALQKTYPALVKDSEPSMMSGNPEEVNFTSSSQMDDTPKATPASSSAPKGLGLLGPLTDKALDLIKTEKSFIKKETSSQMPSFEDLVTLVANGKDLSSFNFEMSDADLAAAVNKRRNRATEMRSSEFFRASSNLPVLQEEGEDGENGDNGACENPMKTNDAPTLNSLLYKAREEFNSASTSPVSPRKFLNQYMEDGESAGGQLDPFQALNTPPLAVAANRNLGNHSRLLENTSFDGLENNSQQHHRQGPQFLLHQATTTGSGSSPISTFADHDRVSTPNGNPYYKRAFDFGEVSAVSKNQTNSFENSF